MQLNLVKKSLLFRTKNIWNLRENVYKICPTKHGVQRCPTKFNMAMQNGRRASTTRAIELVRGRKVLGEKRHSKNSLILNIATAIKWSKNILLQKNILFDEIVEITNQTKLFKHSKCNKSSNNDRNHQNKVQINFYIWKH